MNLALPAFERWDPRRAVAALAVAAIHVVVIAGLMMATRVQVAPREIVMVLPILYSPPVHKPPAPPKEKPRAVPAPAAPSFVLPPAPPSNAITLPDTQALRGLGDWLACGDPDKLSPEARARCAKRDLGLAPHKDEGFAFIVKAPPAPMSPAERKLHEMQTVDPCMVDKAAHLPFCVYSILYGDKLP